MRFSTAALIFSSVVAPAWAVSLRCVPEKRPYCCTAAASVADLDVSLGIQCTEEPIGHIPHCPNTDVKLCCDPAAVDLLGLGLVTLCELPDDLLADIGGILGDGSLLKNMHVRTPALD